MLDITYAATESLPHAAQAAQGIGALGIDAKALLFQILNFAILLFILRKFAYSPILQILDDRQKAIAQSLEDTKKIQEAREQAEHEYKKRLHDAREKSESIIKQSQQQAAHILEEAKQKAELQSAKLIKDAESRIDQQLTEAKNGFHKEVLTLVAQATKTVIGKHMNEFLDESYIADALKDSQTTTKERKPQ